MGAPPEPKVFLISAPRTEIRSKWVPGPLPGSKRTSLLRHVQPWRRGGPPEGQIASNLRRWMNRPRLQLLFSCQCGGSGLTCSWPSGTCPGFSPREATPRNVQQGAIPRPQGFRDGPAIAGP